MSQRWRRTELGYQLLFAFPMGSFVRTLGRRTVGVVITNDCGMKRRADCGLLRVESQEVLPLGVRVLRTDSVPRRRIDQFGGGAGVWKPGSSPGRFSRSLML
jgi:hypothetical protein